MCQQLIFTMMFQYNSRTILRICDMMSRGSSSLLSRALILCSMQCLPISLILRMAVAHFLPTNGRYCKYTEIQAAFQIETINHLQACKPLPKEFDLLELHQACQLVKRSVPSFQLVTGQKDLSQSQPQRQPVMMSVTQ